MGEEWGIGDAIEVEMMRAAAVDLMARPYEPDRVVRPVAVWVPATVCGLSPLSVAFSDGTRLAVSGIGVRRPNTQS